MDKSIYDPAEPIDPTHCPTCRSGTPPLDPWLEDAIDPAPGA